MCLVFGSLSLMYKVWAGERLIIEKPMVISVSAAVICPGADIGRLCRFLSNLFQGLGGLPGGLGSFIPCGLGGEAAQVPVLDALLFLLGYPAGSGASLVAGDLLLRCRSGRISTYGWW